MRWPLPGSRAVGDAPVATWPQPLRLAVRSPRGAVVDLILGLRWEAVLGRDLTREARRRARHRGATHWSHAGGRAEVVGMTRVDNPSGRPWRTPCAAAQSFARVAGPGVHLAWLSLPDNQAMHWLAVVRDGQVLAAGDEVLSAADCIQAARSWSERFGDALSCWGEPWPGVPADVRSLSWARLAEQTGPSAMLHATRRSIALGEAGRLGLWTGAAALTIGVAVAAWWWARPEPVPMATESQQAPPGPEVWHDALAQWHRDTSLPTLRTMQELVAAVLQVPVDWQGWRVQRVACRRTHPEHWRCRTEYRRSSAAAQQAGVKAALPATWQLHWRDLDHFAAVWPFVGQERESQPQELRAHPARWLVDADRLQSWRAAWQRMEVGPAEPVLLRPGLDGGVSPPPQPPGWQAPTQRSLLLYGPLRSLSVLDEALTRRIAWHAIDIQFGNEARPGLTRSALMLTLQGTLYESTDPGLSPI